MKYITKILGLAVVVLLFTVPVVQAQTPGQRSEVTQSETEVQQSTDKQAAREQRIAERKERLQIKLDTAQTQRLKTRCKGAQGKINSVIKRVNGIQTSRQQKYTNLLNRLERLVEQLQTKEADTTGLEEKITELKQLITDYETALQNHMTTLEDLTAIDCEADPEAFQATLTEARSDSLASVKSSTIDIKEFLNGQLKSELKKIRQSLVNADEDITEEPANDEPVVDNPDQPVSNEEQQ